MNDVLLTRDSFRESVFARDRHKCVICHNPAVDAHHIIERRLWVDGGYYIDNGASLCEQCHIKAEQTLISCDVIRKSAGITKIILPQHLYADTIYDKWGNAYLDDGSNRRYIGELYYDENVSKILKSAGIYDNKLYFAKYVKYPRTYHLPWSPGGTDDDKRLNNDEVKDLFSCEIIVTAKMDGENCNMYRHGIHARSLDDKRLADRDWVKNLWSTIRHDIPEGWRLCGENLFATHSLMYKGLPSYFMLFSIWNERNECLSWSDTVEFAELLGVCVVPTIYNGMWPGHDTILGKLMTTPYKSIDKLHEGYVVRTKNSFHFRDFRKSVAKYVRQDHVAQHAMHWRRRAIVKNELE